MKMIKPEIKPEEMMLSFFNDYLYAEGVITKEECEKMRVAIRSECRK